VLPVGHDAVRRGEPRAQVGHRGTAGTEGEDEELGSGRTVTHHRTHGQELDQARGRQGIHLPRLGERGGGEDRNRSHGGQGENDHQRPDVSHEPS